MKQRTIRYYRPPSTRSAQTGSAIAQMNMTPLIDVLLVLIVMLILTVPIMTHNLEVPLPSEKPGPYEVQDHNAIAIDADDRLFWNGQPLTRAQLADQLSTAAKMPEPTQVRFAPDANASYDRSAKTIALIKDSGIEKLAFVGNEQYRIFAR